MKRLLFKQKLTKFNVNSVISILNNNFDKIIKNQKNKSLNNKEHKNIKKFLFNFFENKSDETIENTVQNSKENKNLNDKKSYFYEPKYNYDDIFTFRIINDDIDDEDDLEKYYLKSRRDCVENGLKSINDNIIICNKYE